MTMTYTVFDPQSGAVKARSIDTDELRNILLAFGPPEQEPDSDLSSFALRFNPHNYYITPDRDFDDWVAKGKPMHDLPRSSLRNGDDGTPVQGTK
jgi:hypothetical protein